jgi:hypothetical protein
MTTDDDRTDLASALLDGTLPDEAAAAARRDPAVMARVAEMEQARDRLRDVPPPRAEGRDAALATALAAFDTAAHEPVSPVSDLQAQREARGGRRQAPRWLGAAAAVALVAAGVGVVAALSQHTGGSDEDQATVSAADEAPSEAGGDSATSAESDQGASAAPEGAPAPSVATTIAPAQLGDLGSFSSPAELITRLRQDAAAADALAGTSGAELNAPSRASTFGCTTGDVPEVLSDQATTVVAHGSARVDDTPVTVWVVDTATGRRAVVLDAGCRTVVDRLLE